MNKEVVFISGASRGIGTAIAESFAKLGHTVIGTSRSEFKFKSKLDNLIPLALDITDRNSIKNCTEYLKDNNLKPSILINNAGIALPGKIIKLDYKYLLTSFQVNFFAPSIITSEVLKLMKKKYTNLNFNFNFHFHFNFNYNYN